ncbi:hypothetical protein VKI22_12590 [Cyanobacterium aponinum UTEX 3221]|uniref:hypothetical protein n=1 Tax=Cyanobacterium aponinum TaxID=379064 RepID=UPI002B4BB23F|nr:hypothetical protein [Cyanobacterium aponinum]WRL37460.1 hypothetical protein VKI22_12590 [Cyanobacterium aponinum UTEX 3221]
MLAFYGSTAVDPYISPLTTLFVVTYGNSTQTRCLMGVLRQQDKICWLLERLF